jgi:hypothetical protein
MNSLIKGLLISIILLFTIGILLFLFGIKQLQELGALYLLIPTFPIIGLTLGYAARIFQTKRYAKLLLLGLGLIYLSALLLSTFLILQDDSKSISMSEIPASIFFLSTTGFLIYGILIFPLLAFGVFILERWTRTTE